MPSDFTAKPPYNVVQPGAYSAVDSSLLANPDFLTNRPIPMVLGVAQGAQPLKALYFTSPGKMLQALRGGPGYDVARFCFDGGAPQVGFVRVGNSVSQATKSLAATTGVGVTLTSKDYGTWTNSIEVTVAGTGPIITISYTDAVGTVYTERYDLTGVSGVTAQKIADAINGVLAGFTASAFVTATAGAGTLPLTTASQAPMTGGTDGTSPVAQDWTNGLSAIETEQIDFVLVATGDSTIHAQALAHCQAMSAPLARHERVTVVGGVLGESETQAVARLAALPSARAELAYPGFWDYNAQGVLTLYDPFYLAGKYAGMWCANEDVATSLVHKSVPIIQAEVDLSTIQGGALDALLQGNVSPVAPKPGGGYWIVDALTGYTGSDGVFHDMISTRSADYVAQYMRQYLEQQFVGAKRLKTSQGAVQQAANAGLDELSGLQIIQDFNLPQVQSGPIKGSWSVDLPVMLIDTDKFIFITVGLQPSSTANSSTTATDALT